MHDTAGLIAVARGKKEPDLVLKQAKVINVFTGEICESDVAISEGMIAGLGRYSGPKEVDLAGLFLAPGFIDGHVHLESTMVVPPEFARAVVPRGTTAVVADPHEIANVLGTVGIRYLLDTSRSLPLRVYLTIPSCVPASPFETSGGEVTSRDLPELYQEKRILGLGEMMNFPGVLAAEPEILAKIKASCGRPIDGHAPGLTGKDLCAYVAARITSDHECTTPDEALEKLRLGMHVMIREGSATRNLLDLLPVVTPENLRRCMLVTDDRHPEDLLREGHLDHAVRKAISAGLDPVAAIRMVTINTAEYFGLNNLGAVAPGYLADLVVIEDLFSLQIGQVYHQGELVAEGGRSLFQAKRWAPEAVRNSVKVPSLSLEKIKLEAKSDLVRVIRLVPKQVVTTQLLTFPKVSNNEIIADPDRDILKLCVVERHHATGRVGVGLVQGFGLKNGAIACSVAHDSHNIIAVGVADEDILLAIDTIARNQGGLVLAAQGKILGVLALPIAGLMALGTLEEVARQLEDLHQRVAEMGVMIPSSFMALSFLSLSVIPELKLTDRGLVDVEEFRLVDISV
ncbi:MAG: adenine deaminase [Syntrophomonadaceae bacterium]|nr:adenine deaminase [Syntrophomonadaceae bacterium]